MTVRVTSALLLNRAIRTSQAHTQELAKLQQQASTGLKLFRPSDDPVATRTVIIERVRTNRLEVQVENIEHARSTLNHSVTELLEVNQIFIAAKEIALQANTFEDRGALASQVDRLIERLASVANSEVAGRSLFGGAASGATPYVSDVNDPSLSPGAYTYVGSNARTTIALGNVSVDVLYAGSEVFGHAQRSATTFVGFTGAQPGAGTDSAASRDTLTVRHTLTQYAGASGVAAGTGSAVDDTILGPPGANTLVFDGAGNVSLNNGPPAAFNGTETNLQLFGAGGETAFIDTTSVVGGFTGAVDITADGVLSTDGGVTETAINFSANQVVVDSATGGATNVNSTNIRRTGVEYVEYGDTSNAFQTLITLRDDLRNTRDVSERDLTQAFNRRLGDVDRVREGVLSIIGEQSSTLENLDSLQSRAEDLQIEALRVIEANESADIIEVALNLQTQQNLLQFTLASTAQVLDISLLDFLR